MEIRGIDVSSYNETIDWKKVKNSGIEVAILRITQIKNRIDEYFERNYKGCVQNGVKVGVYKYSYAKNATEAEAEAKAVLDVLNRRKLDYPVWLDLEWEEQAKLGKNAIGAISEAFISVIKKAGYDCHIYCNTDWYNNYIVQALKTKYDFWIALPPVKDDGTVHPSLRPSYGTAWQYSWKGKVDGINGDVDMDLFYKDYSEGKQETPTVDDVIDKLLMYAGDEVGYLEKASNKGLDSKTANAGYGNYTKYWRDIYSAYQGQPWCAVFVTWCFVQAFGKDMTKKLLKHYPFVYCPTLASLSSLHTTPAKGDVVLFYRNGTYAHTGIVKSVSGNTFTTIEGNTSSASGIVDNGGGVFVKSYNLSNLYGTKFFTPDWALVVSSEQSGTSEKVVYTVSLNELKKGSTGAQVYLLQRLLRMYGVKGADGKVLSLDSVYGDNVEAAVKKYQKKKSLVQDGICGAKTWKAIIGF